MSWWWWWGVGGGGGGLGGWGNLFFWFPPPLVNNIRVSNFPQTILGENFMKDLPEQAPAMLANKSRQVQD